MNITKNKFFLGPFKSSFVIIVSILLLKVLEVIVLQKLFHWYWGVPLIDLYIDILVLLMVMTPFTIIVKRQNDRLKLNEKLLKDLAFKDSLTGLPNRRRFEDIFKSSIFKLNAEKETKTAAILFMDLDGFKTLNDSFGHEIGDIFLKEVAKRLLSSVRVNDTVSRLGGDEFIAFLPNIDKKGAIHIVEGILQEIKKPFIMNNDHIFVSASIGMSFYSIDGYDIETLLRKADNAMYQAKVEGKNTYSIFNERVVVVK